MARAQTTALAWQGEGRKDQVGAGSTFTLRRPWPTRPDLWEQHYPDPRCNFRTTLYGLTLEQYRAEFMRRRGEGWFEWELSVRFPRPGVNA